MVAGTPLSTYHLLCVVFGLKSVFWECCVLFKDAGLPSAVELVGGTQKPSDLLMLSVAVASPFPSSLCYPFPPLSPYHSPFLS